jgi:hypothetical protein
MMARLDRYLYLARVPLRNELLAARVEVIPAEQGCTLYWQTLVEPVEIEVFIKASMEGCLVQIGQVIEQS